MVTKKPLIVIKETFNLGKGTILQNYTQLNNGVIIEESGHFLANDAFIILTERLSSEDERQVRDIIKAQLRVLLWNLYTKQSMLVGS